jgi:glycosyltransferase involved in cell wall biosynthesis
MRFSVVIPTFNRLPLLLRCLGVLEEQQFPRGEFEVLVVDDGSTDGTATAIQRYRSCSGLRLRCLRQVRRGPAIARNLGFKAARGQLVAFLDSDCLPEPNWLAELSRGFMSESIAGVGGTCRVPETSLVNRYISLYRFYEPRLLHGRVVYLVTGNCCFQRRAFAAVGGFDERIIQPGGGEDVELCYRLLSRGYELLYNPRAVVIAVDARSVLQFVRGCYRYGRGLRDVRRRCGGLFWSSRAARIRQALKVLGGPLTVGALTAQFATAGYSLRESLGLSALRYVHLVAYALGYVTA